MAALSSSTSTILTVSTTSSGGSRDSQCGVGSCHPWWLQKLANRNVFVIFFACMEIMQATFYSYFRSVITTLEKQFSVQSQTIGLVLSGKEISQVLCGLLLAYYGGRGNRPRWIASGMAITAFACLVMVSPIFLYLDNRVVKTDFRDEDIRQGLCHAEDLAANPLANVWTNGSGIHNMSTMTGSCDPDLKADTVTALLLLFIGGFIAGVGITLIVTLTYPYLDDNVTKSASAFYISIMTALQVMGPTVGSVLGGLCLRFYVTLAGNPGITADDPKWIGAWWLGFIIIAAAFGAGALIMLLFPRQLEPDKRNEIVSVSQESVKDSLNTKNDKPNLRGLPATIRRLLRNRILVCHAIARCFNLFGTNGFDTFQPKYIESHFRQTASEASFFTGISGNAMRIVGILIVGIVLRFWKPKSIFVNAWNILMDFIYIGSLVALMLLSCPTVEIVGFNTQSLDVNNTRIQLNEQKGFCEANCSCLNVKFTPICLENKNYFSPCHAGCLNYQGHKRKDRIYYNCSCAMADNDLGQTGTLLDESALGIQIPQNNKTSAYAAPVGKSGYCHYSCSSFTIYLIVLGLMRTLIATKKVSRMLIILRCLDEKDKSLGIAFHTMMESLFAYIPCPIIYGALLDAACIMWGTNCGQRANCWLYDSDYLRYVMQGLTLAVIVCGTALDTYVLYLCRSLAFFENPTDENNANAESTPKPQEIHNKNDNVNTLKYVTHHNNNEKS